MHVHVMAPGQRIYDEKRVPDDSKLGLVSYGRKPRQKIIGPPG